MRSEIFAVLASLALASASTSTGACYSTVSDLTDTKSFEFQSVAYCEDRCASYSYAVLKGLYCSCTNTAPLSSAELASSECDLTCQGWPEDTCGGSDAYTVIEINDVISDSASDATTATAASTISTSIAATVIIAPTDINTSVMPTNIITAASSAHLASSTAIKSSSSITTPISTATPTPTVNAAGSLRAGSVAGAVVAGLGLML